MIGFELSKYFVLIVAGVLIGPALWGIFLTLLCACLLDSRGYGMSMLRFGAWTVVAGHIFFIVSFWAVLQLNKFDIVDITASWLIVFYLGTITVCTGIILVTAVSYWVSPAPYNER